MLTTDLMTLVSLIGMMLLRLGVPILAMGLLSAVLRRIVPQASENDHAGSKQRYVIDPSTPQPAGGQVVPVQ